MLQAVLFVSFLLSKWSPEFEKFQVCLEKMEVFVFEMMTTLEVLCLSFPQFLGKKISQKHPTQKRGSEEHHPNFVFCAVGLWTFFFFFFSAQDLHLWNFRTTSFFWGEFFFGTQSIYLIVAKLHKKGRWLIFD